VDVQVRASECETAEHAGLRRSLVICARRFAVVLGAGTIVLSVSACGGSDETIQMPTAPSSKGTRSTPAAPNTKSVKLFGGRTVVVSSVCAASIGLSSLKADAVAAAKQLPRLKQTLLNKRRDLKTFLVAHPQRTLTADDYATYRSLRAAYRSALKRYNRKVRAFNRLADRFNTALQACEID
jgi:hypothetical protein